MLKYIKRALFICFITSAHMSFIKLKCPSKMDRPSCVGGVLVTFQLPRRVWCDVTYFTSKGMSNFSQLSRVWVGGKGMNNLSAEGGEVMILSIRERGVFFEIFFDR